MRRGSASALSAGISASVGSSRSSSRASGQKSSPHSSRWRSGSPAARAQVTSLCAQMRVGANASGWMGQSAASSETP